MNYCSADHTGLTRPDRSDYLGDMIHIVDGESELFLDDALSPFSIATWVGPATLQLIAKFHSWAEQQVAAAKREGKPVIMVNDGTAAGRPPADVRRAFAELRLDPEVPIKSFVVVTNPLVRGAMTAIGWLIGDGFDVINCKTMSEALERAADLAGHLGLEPPPAAELTRYAAGARSA